MIRLKIYVLIGLFQGPDLFENGSPDKIQL